MVTKVSMLSRRTQVFLLLAVILVMVLIGLILVLQGHYEVVRKGQILPYTTGTIYEIRIFDQFTIFAEREIKPSGDVLNSYFLIGISFISLTFLTVLIRFSNASVSDEVQFFLCLFVGSGFLAADELFGIHETIGHNIQFLRGVLRIKRPDDAVVLIYALIGVVFVFYYRNVLLQSRRALILFAVAVAVSVLAALSDLFSLALEELLELASSFCIVLGVVDMGLHTLEKKL